MKVLKIILYSISALVYSVVLGSILVFHGPFHSLKNNVIGTISTTMHPQYLAPLSLWTISANEYKPNMVIQLSNDAAKEKTISQNILRSVASNSDSTIKIEDYKTKAYSAKIMLIPNPRSIKVAVTKYIGDVGQTVSEMIADNHAIAGINGGGFADTGYRGTGGIPLGTTIHDGKIITKGNGSEAIVGFTDQGLLVVGNYTEDQLTQMGVTEALSFGPVLVKDGKGVVQGDGGWGVAPRTAIGQREDGTVIMIVTDGRLIHGTNNVGATIRDLMNLMLKYGAVNASNLDGGSSTTMVNNGVLVNDPTDVLGQRKIATSFIVLPN